jgi:hypothetical protein
MKKYSFGKLPVKHDNRTLMFANYVTGELPKAPESVDKLAEVYRKLKITNPKYLFPMDGNDAEGCCSIAGLVHAKTIQHGLIYDKNILSERFVHELYRQLSGGEDTGLYLLNVLNYWRTHEVDGEKIYAYAKVDHKNIDEVRSALHLFGTLYLGFNVQRNAIKDFEAKKVWTKGKLTGSGHCVVLGAADDKGGKVLTWGDVQEFDWSWWECCVDECYVVLPPQAKFKAFSGFDFEQLQKDLLIIAQ